MEGALTNSLSPPLLARSLNLLSAAKAKGGGGREAEVRRVAASNLATYALPPLYRARKQAEARGASRSMDGRPVARSVGRGRLRVK